MEYKVQAKSKVSKLQSNFQKSRNVELASFPGRFYLQFLITCSMQKRRGKAWEKDSHAWCAGRHEGRCETIELNFVTHKPCIGQPQIYRITSCIDAVFQTLQS